MKILLTILLLSSTIFPCGTAQDITGRVTPMFPRSIIRVQEHPGGPIYTTRTSSFGYFAFRQMAPCNDYRLEVFNKWYSYAPVIFTLPGNEGVEINLEPMVK